MDTNVSPNILAVHRNVGYVIRGTHRTVTGSAVCTVRSIFATAVGLGVLGVCGPLIEQQRFSLPDWALPVDIAMTTVCVIGLAASIWGVEENQRETAPLLQHLFPKGGEVYWKEDLEDRLIILLDQLCERDQNGREISCSLQRAEVIIESLKQEGKLELLNAIPRYFLMLPESNTPQGLSFPLYTLLHYWARKGNLEMVKLFTKNGAIDYFTEGKNAHLVVSGLYLAALFGHLDVVKFLLSNGSPADVAFSHHNVLLCFVPRLVFEMADLIMTENSVDYYFECLRLVLTHLKENKPAHLSLQLRVPIREGKNLLGWIESEYLSQKHRNSSRARQLQDLLQEFGAKNDEVHSVSDLRVKSCNVGNGFTLYQMSTQK